MSLKTMRVPVQAPYTGAILSALEKSPLLTGLYCIKSQPGAHTYELREDGEPTGHEIVLHSNGTWAMWSKLPINIEEPT